MIARLATLIGKILPQKPRRPPANAVYSKSSITPEKQKQLETLCNQLFQKKELITSGKLQFIGLAKLKKKMGKNWLSLSKVVYEVAEEVINKYIAKGDIFIRFKDDTYLILFSRAAREEAEIKAALIANEIKDRLYNSDKKELENFEIKNAIGEISARMLADKSFPDALDLIDSTENVSSEQRGIQKTMQNQSWTQAKNIEVETDFLQAPPAPPPAEKVQILDCSYLPLWEVQKNALTAYLCLPSQTGESDLFAFYKNVCRNSPYSSKVTLDTKILQSAAAGLDHMEKSGRKLFIACPVQYETLTRKESYEKTAIFVQNLPESQKKFLILLVMDIPPVISKDFLGGIMQLRRHCRSIYAEVSLQQRINFQELKSAGFDATGISLENKGPEQETIVKLNDFMSRAKPHGMPLFVLNIPSLSLTTSVVCAGYHFLGGSAIHEPVTEPDNVHRYRHEDLFSGIIQAQKNS